jgi:protein-S-isoprenylcysteine O-methyltransferase Ste14
VLGTVASLLVPAYIRRMEAEERLLVQQLPGYESYAQRTTRLVPKVW